MRPSAFANGTHVCYYILGVSEPADLPHRSRHMAPQSARLTSHGLRTTSPARENLLLNEKQRAGATNALAAACCISQPRHPQNFMMCGLSALDKEKRALRYLGMSGCFRLFMSAVSTES